MTAMFVNLPVTDLERAKAFYTAIGFTINPQFTDHNAACVVVYELTPYGRELEPVVLALGAWGFKAMGDPREEQIITPTR